MVTKAKSIIIEAGSIMLYNTDCKLRRLLNWCLRKKTEKYNRFVIFDEAVEMILTGKKDLMILTPTKKYNSFEKGRLKILKKIDSIRSFADLVGAINIIREDTVKSLKPTVKDLLDCKYYNKLKLDVEQLDEYIY